MGGVSKKKPNVFLINKKKVATVVEWKYIWLARNEHKKKRMIIIMIIIKSCQVLKVNVWETRYRYKKKKKNSHLKKESWFYYYYYRYCYYFSDAIFLKCRFLHDEMMLIDSTIPDCSRFNRKLWWRHVGNV